jgi:hypothetical protein
MTSLFKFTDFMSIGLADSVSSSLWGDFTAGITAICTRLGGTGYRAYRLVFPAKEFYWTADLIAVILSSKHTQTMDTKGIVPADKTYGQASRIIRPKNCPAQPYILIAQGSVERWYPTRPS